MSSFVNLLEIIYPIGSCYFSTESTSPSEFIGGTWEQMTGGVLGLVGSTGIASAGENGGSTKISTEQLPAHSHDIVDGTRKYCLEDARAEAKGYGVTQSSSFKDRMVVTQEYLPTSSTWEQHSFSAISTGGGKTTFLLILLSMVGSALPRSVC